MQPRVVWDTPQNAPSGRLTATNRCGGGSEQAHVLAMRPARRAEAKNCGRPRVCERPMAFSIHARGRRSRPSRTAQTV